MNKTLFLKMQNYIKNNDILSFEKNFKIEFVNEFYTHDTLLSMSVLENKLDFVRYLLNNNADPNLKYLDDNTVLHFACQSNHLEIVKLLCDYGANINAKNKYGNTPVWVAVHECKLKYFDLVEYLSTKSPIIDEKNNYNISIKERVLNTNCQKLIDIFNLGLQYK